jgi:hypothetical protein
MRRDDNLVSVFASDANCPACLTEIERLAAMGFFPRK